ncbi:hypothetical protein ACVIHH_005165 [Bradyrhizobium sp. USDA 4518]|nr:hypothetical protein [Bradyrhizobium sp. USDA 4545]MCP1912861.1 hypothetical protein [Bradyrhizobium elkanii]MCP1923328.1 hypothetical protein [Bradyrhizobium sp. USDA 4532]
MIVVPAGVKVYLTLGRTDMSNGLAVQRNSPWERLNANPNSRQAREIADIGLRFRRRRTARKMSLVTRWSRMDAANAPGTPHRSRKLR